MYHLRSYTVHHVRHTLHQLGQPHPATKLEQSHQLHQLRLREAGDIDPASIQETSSLLDLGQVQLSQPISCRLALDGGSQSSFLTNGNGSSAVDSVLNSLHMASNIGLRLYDLANLCHLVEHSQSMQCRRRTRSWRNLKIDQSEVSILIINQSERSITCGSSVAFLHMSSVSSSKELSLSLALAAALRPWE